jgi:hypothetical protein
MQAGKLEPEGFFKTHHDIHGLSASTIKTGTGRAQFKSDIAVIGTCQQLRLGVTINTNPRKRNSSKSNFSSLPTIEHGMPILILLKSSLCPGVVRRRVVRFLPSQKQKGERKLSSSSPHNATKPN